MTRVQYSEEPAKILYMPLPDGVYKDVRLCVNVQKIEGEEGERWEADEHYFRTGAAFMNYAYIEAHFDELLSYDPAVEQEEVTENLLLEVAADHELRICLLELGVTL